MVRTAPLRLSGLVTVTSERAVTEFSNKLPLVKVPLPMPPVPKLTWAFAPPKFTVRGAVLAAKPPLTLKAVPTASVHWT